MRFARAIVVLNRAAAISQAEGASAGLEALHGLGNALDGYGPYHAAQADMLRRDGRTADAADADGRALELRCAAPRAEGHRG